MHMNMTTDLNPYRYAGPALTVRELDNSL